MIAPQYFLHFANILFVLSYSVRDIMLLRVFALCGSLISIPYYYLQANVLWQPIGWAAIFMTINGYHVWRLWRERRPIELSSDEAKLYELTFFPLTRRRFRDLARLGQWTDLKAGDVLVRPGQPIDEVVVPLTDSIDARIGEQLLGRYAAGEIVGAAAFSGHPPRFEAIASENCRVLRVPAAAIKQHAERDDQLARTLERIAREDLARKLERLVGQGATLSPTPGYGNQPPSATR
jgi:CRP-like cAMP-binding protein